MECIILPIILIIFLWFVFHIAMLGPSPLPGRAILVILGIDILLVLLIVYLTKEKESANDAPTETPVEVKESSDSAMLMPEPWRPDPVDDFRIM